MVGEILLQANELRLLAVFQMLWFSAGLIQRASKGYEITTLELTTASFAVIMFSTSAIWYCKPSITQPRFISTKDSKTIMEIREFSQLSASSYFVAFFTQSLTGVRLDSPYVSDSVVSDAA